MGICGRGWAERCAKANPYSDCVCSCGGDNHGIYREFRKTWRAPSRPLPRSVATDDDDGELLPLKDEDWLDISVHDRTAFGAGLEELGLNQQTTDELLKHYDEAAGQVKQWKLPPSWFFRDPDERIAYTEFISSHIAKSALAVWLGLLDRRVEETITQRVEIPLFKLHSPKVPGSKVSYVESDRGAEAVPWSITVFGSGMGKTRKFVARFTQTLDCSNGDCKMIFVPVTMKVEKVATYLRGNLVGRGLRTEMVLEKATRVSNGIETLAEDQCSSELETADDFDYEADYSRDLSHDTHRIEWTGTWTDTTEFKIGLSAFSSKAECNTVVTRDKEIGLIFVLPAGHRYQLKQCRKVRGVAWAVDRGTERWHASETA